MTVNNVYLFLAYHCKCVDPWLTKTKRTCPVCKQKVVPAGSESDSDSDSGGDESEEVSESTPLLRPQPPARIRTPSLASTHSASTGPPDCSDSDSTEEEEEGDVVTVETVVVLQQAHPDDDLINA